MLQIESNPEISYQDLSDNDDYSNKQLVLRNNETQLIALSDIEEQRDTVSELSSHHSNIAQSLSISNSFRSDLQDLVLNLPENWAQLDFKSKKSCILSNIYSTCVTKAISHLEALQNCIETWIVNVEKCKALPESTSSVESTKRLLQYVRKRNSISYRNDLKPFETMSKPIDKLYLTNKDKTISFLAESDQTQTLDLIVEEKQEPIEDIKMGGILEELLVLLFRLELDRRRTEHQLEYEKQIFLKLKNQIENISYKRAVDLPAKVQHEHDSCITDITELNWHISFNIKSELKLKRKVEVEQKVYEKLKEEIDEMKTKVPLIEEKSEIEASLLQKIEDAQADVNELVEKAKEKYQNTLDKSKQAHFKAEKERANMQADLASCKRDLNKAKKRLQEAEQLTQTNLKILEESQIKMSDNTAQERKEMSRKGQLRQKNDKLNDQTNFLATERIRLEKDIERIENDNKQLVSKLKEKKEKLELELDGLKEVLKGKDDKLDKIIKKINEKETDLEDMNNHLTTVQKNIEKDARNRDRLLMEREGLENDLKNAELNYQEIVKSQADIKNENKKERKKMEMKEEALQKQVTELKKGINEERSIAGTLLGRMKNDMEEYEKAKLDAQKKRLAFEESKTELDTRLADLDNKVNEIEKNKLALDGYVSWLNSSIKSMKENHINLETKLTSRLTELEPIFANNFAEHDKNKKKIEFIKSHTNEINGKMREILESINLMKKSIETLGIETDELNYGYKECSIRLVTSIDLNTKSQKSLSEQSNRLISNETTHQVHIEKRSDYLRKLKSQLKDNMDLNQVLASRYRDLKLDLYSHKINVMRAIEKKLDTLTSLKDKRQVKCLQERMHAALKDYYNYNKQNSDRNIWLLNVKRDENADKISSIEEMLQATVLHITRYLHNEMDFSKLSQKAMAKVRKDEIIEKNKQEEEEEEEENESKLLLKSKESTLLSKKSVVFSTNLIDAI